MDQPARHQCLIYHGAPSQHLRTLSYALRDHLRCKRRCLYLNSEPMIAGMRSYLAAADVNVAEETASGSLVFSAERPHLNGDGFDGDAMLRGLESELDRALQDGYTGLFATGDMSWELGPNPDLAKLVTYERSLERLFQARSELFGVCQYHADTVSPACAQHGLQLHRALFVNDRVTRLNDRYCPPESHK